MPHIRADDYLARRRLVARIKRNAVAIASHLIMLAIGVLLGAGMTAADLIIRGMH